MMRCLIIAACLVAAAIAQWGGGGDQDNRPDWFNQIDDYLSTNDDTVDRFHEFRFEYHHNRGEHLMIAIDDHDTHKECHFVEIDNDWEYLLNDTMKVTMISEEIYHLIKLNNAPETELSLATIAQAYGDRESIRECYSHKIFLLTYTPSMALQTTVAPMAG